MRPGRFRFVAVVAGRGRLRGERRGQLCRRVLARELPTLIQPVPGAARLAQQGAVGQGVAAHAPEIVGGLEAQAGREQCHQGIVIACHRFERRALGLPHAATIRCNRGRMAAKECPKRLSRRPPRRSKCRSGRANEKGMPKILGIPLSRSAYAKRNSLATFGTSYR